MKPRNIFLIICFFLAGCVTDYKEAAFVIQAAVADAEISTGLDYGFIKLTCDSGPNATCPDRVGRTEVTTAQMIVQGIIHSTDLRRMDVIYDFPIYNLPKDFTGCAMVDAVINRQGEALKTPDDIDEDLINKMIDRINVFAAMPVQKCWSDAYEPTGYEYKGMQSASGMGSRIIKMNTVEWEVEDVQY